MLNKKQILEIISTVRQLDVEEGSFVWFPAYNINVQKNTITMHLGFNLGPRILHDGEYLYYNVYKYNKLKYYRHKGTPF